MSNDLGLKAKRTLQEFVPVIDDKIAKYFDEELELGFGFNKRQKQVVQEALIHTKDLVLRPQKHLRGSFVVYGYKLDGGEVDERVWQAAVAVEIVHGALLMHDDFMDEDEIRRGGPTTHKYFQNRLGGDLHVGEAMAVSVGDAALCVGFELLESCDNVLAMRQMLRGIANTAYGQAYDVSLEAFGNWSEEDVIMLHRAKTAIYTYENPLFIGAQLASLPKRTFGILREYAMDGGVAFQLQDDILGVFGTPEKTGKSSDSDLKQGKCTLLVLKAMEGSKSQVTAVKKVWGDRNARREDLDAAKAAIIESGSLEYNKQLAKKYAQKAAKTAEKLRKLKLNPEAADYIQGVAEYMVTREV